jgi:uncharacterized membrane protein YhaH (DUF805 family)
MAVLSVALVVAWLVDDRTLLGAPLWAKPLKFALSFTFYGLTLAWLLSRSTRARRLGWWTGTVAVVASLVEMVVITGQAARGSRSHFNTDTAFDQMLFSLMGATVAVIYVATLVVGVLLLRSRLQDPATAWALRLGVLVSLLGMSVGVVMVVNQGHAVGVADGGPGLPLLGWSTTGGDLRIGHFVGMHALQGLPLLAGLLSLRGRDLDASVRLRVVLVAAAAYAAVVVLVTWQALRGQPLLAPDGLTLAAAALVAAGAAAALARQGRRVDRVPALATH